MSARGDDGLAGLLAVAGGDDGHVGEDPGQGQVLQGLVGGPVGAHGDPRVGAAEADVQVIIAHGGADLVKSTAGQEDPVRGDIGGQAPRARPAAVPTRSCSLMPRL